MLTRDEITVTPSLEYNICGIRYILVCDTRLSY